MGAWWSAHKPTKRRLIQLYAALLTNANLKGFATGQIYRGEVKNACVPGLNCYSCPGAAASCPLGALQNALAESRARTPYYIFGIILLFGLLLGRTICGFLCPFGLIQDLLHKIPTPKLKKGRVTRILSYLKYVILAVFVIILPLIYAFRDFPLPAFCKYICPAGTLGGAMGLLANEANSALFGMLGPLFTWKFVLLISVLVTVIFVYRAFCRFLCPLGALYGLFNRISLLGIKLDRPSCVDCGRCQAHCKMDIRHVGDAECISCGDCIAVCPTNAISYKGSQIILPPNEVGDSADVKDASPEAAATQPKAAKRTVIFKAVALVLAGALLIGSLLYYNVFYDGKVSDLGKVYTVGEFAPTYEMPLYGADAPFSIEDTRNRITVINFWGTWCGPCVAELPHFDEAAREYGEQLAVIAIHTDYKKETMAAFVEQYYPDSPMYFCTDGEESEYYFALGGMDTYPMTVVIDRDGIITAILYDSVTYETLIAAIENAM